MPRRAKTGQIERMPANSDPTQGQRLDSWKEIAAFLGRGERTVKRWETERGLPVHRVPGGGRSAVFAYTKELSEWLKGKSHELEENDATSDSTAIPENARPETGSAAPQHVGKGLSSSPGRVVFWLVFLALIGVAAFYYSASRSGSRGKALAAREPGDPVNSSLGPDSVAVLPFTNVRGDASTEYLIDGITESLIGNLAHLPQLKVRSRDAVFRYKGKDSDMRATGSELGVSVLVSGRVLLQGDSIDVSVELTRVRENTEIWGHRYTGKTANLISIQQRMAGDIAKELRSSLSSANRQRAMQQGTLDPDAFALYLKGRYEWNKRTSSDLQNAISYFDQAIGKDPAYALAYSGLADAYSVLPNFGGNPAEDFPKSNAAARKALELDPSLARPHAVLGMNETEYDWDFVSGEAEFRKAIELDPNDATAHQWYAEKLSQRGRHDEALAEIKLAQQLDPSSLVIKRVLSGTLLDAGRADEAIGVCKQLAQENPTFAMAHDCLAFAYWDKGMYAQMVEETKIYAQMTGNPEEVAFATALEEGYASGGWKGAMTRAAVTFEALRKNGYESPFKIARLYACAGDDAQAFYWLDVADREHDRLLLAMGAYQFNGLRSDPRFVRLAHKVGLPAAGPAPSGSARR